MAWSGDAETVPVPVTSMVFCAEFVREVGEGRVSAIALTNTIAIMASAVR